VLPITCSARDRLVQVPARRFALGEVPSYTNSRARRSVGSGRRARGRIHRLGHSLSHHSGNSVGLRPRRSASSSTAWSVGDGAFRCRAAMDTGGGEVAEPAMPTAYQSHSAARNPGRTRFGWGFIEPITGGATSLAELESPNALFDLATVLWRFPLWRPDRDVAVDGPRVAPQATRRTDACGHRPMPGGAVGTSVRLVAAGRTRTTRNGQSILANRSQAEAIASCSASSFRCRGTDVAARSFQYGAEARSASVQQ